ncbi:hypothetical protein N473_26140 [Pseudoalteromonas luteoviolacea CPMOR-1]|uniref:Uncharacterized protein n=1 Tax=Pseudoalteromonas luteoviolacea CPMOR-1 TaxID=1365248 RepID=A0A167I4V9_9GAMM|nr:hypothetical protein [Pseudoalteromonas luteoviolacea]KZN58900.1 hypothetical protein N473_26140 [Pseudoalteromonas luteoviolacea CPMOR-1]
MSFPELKVIILRAHYPSAHALIDDWYNHGKYFVVFLLDTIWHYCLSLIAQSHTLLMFALLRYSFIILDRYGYWYGFTQYQSLDMDIDYFIDCDGCYMMHEIIKRFGLVKILFGLLCQYK